MDTVRGTLLGYRSWTYEAGRLIPLMGFLKRIRAWESGINHAICKKEYGPDTSLGVPHEDHHCGFNAWFDFFRAQEYSGVYSASRIQVYGSIAGAGKVCIHSEGFRSEQAQILSLLVPEELEPFEIEELRMKYRVELFTSEEDFLRFNEQFSNILHRKRSPETFPDYENSWLSIVWPKDSVDDQPSRILEDGTKEWFKNGRIHRDNDLPAVIHPDGKKKWYQNGKLHRDDGPAVEGEHLKEWYAHGKRHRSGDRPAHTTPEFRGYYKDGLLHREGDLPAVVWTDGNQEWWFEGLQHREGDKPALISEIGEFWYKNGYRHRAGDRPAVIKSNGNQEWWFEGVRHRDNDLPAWVSDSTAVWWKHGKRDREDDLPTEVIFALSNKVLFQENYGREHYDRATCVWYKNDMVHRDGDKPAIVTADGRKEWYQYGEIHRDDKPAIEGPNGFREHRQDGQLHRLNGPAVLNDNGDQEWWVEGEFYYRKIESESDLEEGL